MRSLALLFSLPCFLPLLLAAFAAQAAPVASDQENLAEKTGGETTVYATGRNAFSFPAANLTDAERTRFAIGNSFFKRNWVQAPASTTARDGLGPHFIARSCGGCHVNDGRGAPPLKAGEQPVGLLVRLSIPGVGTHGGVTPEPTYGDQFNNFAVQGVKPEGQVRITHRPVKGRFADGTPYTLLKPTYQLEALGYGPLAKDALISPRIAPQVIGMGLLEAIPEAELERNVAAQKAGSGPINGAIKGQINHVWDTPLGKMLPGRLGWKANVATVAHQTAGAFNGDIGITSPVFPHEGCTAAQADCLAAPSGGKKPGTQDVSTEIDAQTLADVTFYQATLAPPARRNLNDKRVQRGEKLFHQTQCAVCHRPEYVTGPSAHSPALANQRITPYTDLLLHDMGEALADGRPDGQANGQQWKTPPLWGVGLIRDVNQHTRLLHDGRANGVLEAVLWHGGEAEASKRQVLKLKKSDRDALVKFVESL